MAGEMKSWVLTLPVQIPAECTAEQIESGVREMFADQFDSWVVQDVEVVEA